MPLSPVNEHVLLVRPPRERPTTDAPRFSGKRCVNMHTWTWSSKNKTYSNSKVKSCSVVCVLMAGCETYTTVVIQ